MDGQTIFSAMRAAYTQCSSYQDTGDVVSVFIHDAPRPRRSTDSQPFSTWFLRPNRIRFEFADRDVGPAEEWDRYVVWERDGLARAWWSVRGEERSANLSMLLAGATGVSGSSAIRVPRMLMPERLHQGGAVNAKLAGTEEVSGVACHTLELRWNHGERAFGETWWIGKHDYLLRKVFNTTHLGGESSEQMQVHIRNELTKAHAEGKITRERMEELLRPVKTPEPFRVESTTTYTPVVNAPIRDDLFHFEPPN